MKNKFFQYRQNNSGGHFYDPAALVVVRADSEEEANALASEHFTPCGTSGRYADYDDCGCCPCCGHRWDEPDELLRPEDFSANHRLFGMDGHLYMGAPALALIKKNGELLVSVNEDELRRIEALIKGDLP